MKSFISIASLLLICSWGIPASLWGQGKDRNTLVQEDRSRVLGDGFWIYNDVEHGLEQARQTGKPLLVIFRCIPCEACAQLDEEVVENNLDVRKRLSQFVCVRVVHANGLDLARFQFDYDQSWVAFFLNGDGSIYGRYGTRSHQTESEHDVTLAGFLETMRQVLALHARFPEVKPALADKVGPPPPVAAPEEFPKLKENYTSKLEYEGPQVARSCIHCHQVGEAWREYYRDEHQAIPAEIMYPYPHPKVIGLTMDPTTAATVSEVAGDSLAEQAGLRSGDEIEQMDGQPIVSVADMQWVFHNSKSPATLPLQVRRGGQSVALELELPKGWKEQGDISWRATSWALRRMTTGGLRLTRAAPSDEVDGVGLRVEHVGQWNEHAAAKRAGFKKDDIFISVDGRSEPMSEGQLFAYLLRNKQPGDRVEVVVLRDGQRRTLSLPIQD